MAEDECVFSPQEFLRYVASVRGVDVETFRIPPQIVMVYPRRYFDLVVRLINGRPVEWWRYKDHLKMSSGSGSFNNVQMVVVMNFVGSSAAAMVFEELIACGARQTIVGVSGGIQPFLKPGDIVIASEAICDEGTTSQYFEGPQKFEASQKFEEPSD